jgi:hypothetical protein
LRLDDELTNPADDRLGARAEVVLRRSPWSSRPTRIGAEAHASVERLGGGTVRAVVEGRIVLETDVVALADFLVPKLQLASARQGDRSASPADAAFASMVYDKLARTPRCRSLDDLADLLVYVAGIRLSTLNVEIENLSGALAAADEGARPAIEERLAAARLRRDELFKTRPHLERGPDGRAQELVIAVEGVQLGAASSIDVLQVGITAQRIQLAVRLAVVEGAEWFAVVKPLVVGTLRRVQERDAATFALLRGLAAPWFDRAGELLPAEPAEDAP